MSYDSTNRHRLLLSISLLVLVPILTDAQTSGSFSNFRGNQQLTGYFNIAMPERVSLLWSFYTGDEIKSSPVVQGNRIVTGSADGNVYCLDQNGRQIWKFTAGNAIEATALIHGGNVYIGDLSGNLYSLRLEDGEMNWLYKTQGQIMGAPNWWTDGNKTYILIGSYDYLLHCVDAARGSVVWTYETTNFINGAVAIEGNNAIFGGCDGLLHVVDIPSGTSRRKIEVATYIAGSPSLDKGKAYMGDYDGYVTCVDYNRETFDWTWANEASQISFIASPALSQDRVVIGNRDRYVYCLDRNTGGLIWKTNTGSQVEASAIVTVNRVLAANMSGVLMLMDLSDGSVIWSYEIGSAVFSNPAILQGKIIFGSQDGSIYCLGAK
ncbi:MAG: PQQ-binding-like beta-propeller repeat protein [Bacteroidales bacterium]|nr:PQQ-binding-like beta-propeller repeat protein [Bacteroidales bacterium]